MKKTKIIFLLYIVSTLVITVHFNIMYTRNISFEYEQILNEKIHSQQQRLKKTTTTNELQQKACVYPCKTGERYEEGDGYDEEAIKWSNIDDMITKWGQTSEVAYESFLHSEGDPLNDVVIAIIDSGITRDMWYNIEFLTDCDIEVYVNWEYDSNKNVYNTPSLVTDDPDDLPYIGPPEPTPHLKYADRHEHGSNIAWLISKAANGVKLWIIDVQDSDIDYTGTDGIRKACRWLDENLDNPQYSGLDIVTMSFTLPGFTYTYADMECLLDLQEKGIILFAAAGNAQEEYESVTGPPDTFQYPRSFDFVWGIGSHFDDLDNKLTDDETFIDEATYRVSYTRTEDYRVDEAVWASQYSSTLDKSVHFMAPGFDYETRARDYSTEIVIDGTSFAAPHAASIAAYAVATCNYAYSYSQTEIWDYTFEALKKAGEKIGSDQVGLMYLNSAYPSGQPTRETKIGYGSIDAYDTIRYLLGGEIVSGGTSVSYGNYNGNPYFSKSSTIVDIFRPGEYTIRANYRVNEGSWQINDQIVTFVTADRYNIPSRWLASTNLGDRIDVCWEVLSPTTANTLNVEDTTTSLTLPDAVVLTSSYIYRYDFPIPYKAKSRMYFDIGISGNYTIVVSYKRYIWGPPPYGGAWDSTWTQVYNEMYYYDAGTNYFLENYLGEFDWWVTKLKCCWSIYDDQNNLIFQYIVEG